MDPYKVNNSENEQLAFCPAIVVPGVYYSDDKLLQTHIFSYSETQRHRLGQNYLQLPAPKCAHHNNHHEGFMNFIHRDEGGKLLPFEAIIEKENNFKQPAGEKYRSWAPHRQERFICRWVDDTLSDPCATYEIRSIWISYWSQKLASRLNIRPSI